MTTSRDNALQTYLGISEIAPEARTLRLLLEFGVQAVGGDEGSLLVYDRERRDLVFAMTTAQGKDEPALLGQRLPLGTGLTGLAAVTRTVQVGAPTYTLEGVKTSASPREPEAVLAAPMLVGEDLVGVVTAVSFKQGMRFLAENAGFYGRMAAIAGVLVQQRRRIDMLEKLATGRADARTAAEGDPLEAAVIASVGRLCRRPQADLADVARLLSAIEAVLGRGATS